MTNKTRRKINRIAYSEKIGHLDSEDRIANKALNGKPIRSLTDEERRYWAKVNRYCRNTGKPPAMAADMLEIIAA